MTSIRPRLALLFAAAALGGCAVVPAYDYGPSYGYDQPAVIAYAVPPGQAWVPRVWQREGERWHSHAGHWQQRRDDHHLSPQPVRPRREFHSQQQHQRPPELQRRPEGPLHRVLSEAQRMSPAVAPRSMPPARPAEATPRRRGGDEGRHNGRRGPDDGEPHERRRLIP